jgi:hypothetical protein
LFYSAQQLKESTVFELSHMLVRLDHFASDAICQSGKMNRFAGTKR